MGNVTIEKKYSIPELSKILDVDRSTIYRWVWENKLKFERVGSRNRVSESELKRFIEAGGKENIKKDDKEFFEKK